MNLYLCLKIISYNLIWKSYSFHCFHSSFSNAMSLIVEKVNQGPLVPKTATSILFTISIDLPSHGCLRFICSLLLPPSVSSVWIPALVGSLCVCVLPSDSQLI